MDGGNERRGTQYLGRCGLFTLAQGLIHQLAPLKHQVDSVGSDKAHDRGDLGVLHVLAQISKCFADLARAEAECIRAGSTLPKRSRVNRECGLAALRAPTN
jgi:hypothetical protein